METKSSEVVFFLGAGASVAAGVPDTYSFVTEYLKSIQNDSEKKPKINKIIEALERWKNDKIDIEILLETLTKLENKNLDPLPQFYSQDTYLLKGYPEKEPLIKDLKNFIKKMAIVSEDKIQYLQHLRPIIEEKPPLDIISVNYDTSIEQFCNVQKLTYQDGFDDHWNPKTFDKEHSEIRLYKIHGSVMWYQTDRGDYVKIPIMTEDSEIQLITKEKAENLMLYPMQKWDYAEPFLELSVKIKRLLESETCKFLVIIGYSFRDEHIVRILWDSARKNRNLRIILVDPHAYKIYRDKLKFYDDNKTISSSVSGKVICLPYLFEKVLPYLKNYYLLNLRVGISCESAQRKLEIAGDPANYFFCIKNFIDAEYIENAELLMEKINLNDKERPKESIEFPLRMGLNLCLGGEEDRAIKKFKIFNDCILKVLVERLHVDVHRITNQIDPVTTDIEFEWVFNYYKTSPSGYSSLDRKDFIELIKSQIDFCQKRIDLSPKKEECIENIFKKLCDIMEYFTPLEGGKIGFVKYIELRKDTQPLIGKLLKNYSRVMQKHDIVQEQIQSLGQQVEEIEKGILIKFIKENEES